ncbi:ABC transporter ATP-binding protein [Alicyclobacillus fastidiosus]
MKLVELEGITKQYQTGSEPFYAVRDVNLTINHGDFVAIMGPSGSGKSTMMHMMGLLDTPTSGEIIIDGIRTSGLNDKRLAAVRNERIGFVFQNFNLLPRTSALENVALPLFYGNQKADAYLARAERALERVGLDPRQKGWNHPNQLSGGQQQRVAIARAIVTEPNLLLADEPTGNLDSQSTNEILALFQRLNEDGVTIVMVTHEDEVARHAKRIVRFRDGHMESDRLIDPILDAR